MSIASFFSERQRIKRSFGLDRRLDLYEDVATFIQQGLGPKAALSNMLAALQERKRPAWKIKLLKKVCDSKDDSFADALAPFIPSQEASMLTAGEKANSMVAALLQTVELLRIQQEVRTKLWVVFGPAIPLLLSVLIIYALISVNLYDQLGGLSGEDRLMQLSIAGPYFALGRFIYHYAFVIAGVVLAILALIAWSFSNWKPSPTRQWADSHLPPWTLYSRIQVSFFLLSVMAMMKAGQPFKTIVGTVSAHASPWMRGYLRVIENRLKRGDSEIRALQLPFLPDDVKDRFAVYAKTGGFIHVIGATASHSNKILLKLVDRIGGAINFAFKVLIAIFVLATVASLLQAGFDVATSIRSQSF